MKQELICKFRDSAASGDLPRLLAANATCNVEFPTLGGEVFWQTYRANGWKLQVNVLSGWWRILDAENIRVARGTKEEQLEALLNNRPTSVFTNYLDQGGRFVRTEAMSSTGRTVVLIHGWGVRAHSMQKLASALAREGFEADNYDYPTSKCSLEEHCRTFLLKFRELLGTLPQDEKIYLLTHSMGGLVLRGAMASLTEAECRRIKAIVMLGPPNRGSILAYLGKLPVVNEFNASLRDMAPDSDSFVSNIPAPAFLPPVGIIAGRFDGKVALEDTLLPKPLPCKRIVVDCTHPGLRDPAKVMSQTLEFFSSMSFNEELAMSSFLPPRFPFGRKPSPLYLCECPKCGFRQSYELGDPGEVIATAATDSEDILTVATIPSTCPKCGAKWKKTQMPDLRKF